MVLGSSVSLNSTVTVCRWEVILGETCDIGEKVTPPEASLRLTSTYSSNSMVILLDLKFNVESFGLMLSNLGGMVSRGPPSGGIIFAQPVVLAKASTVRIRIVKK